jgi:hypothetical protein
VPGLTPEDGREEVRFTLLLPLWPQVHRHDPRLLGRTGPPDAELRARGPTWSDLADALSRWTDWPPWAAHGVLAAALLLLAWWLQH